MFLHILNDRQQQAFLAVAQRFIEADTHLAEAEQNLLELMYAETGLPFDTELPKGDFATLLEPFDSKQARAVVVLELIGIGHADEDFHADENTFVRQVAATLDISDEDVEAMESWINRQLALTQEVERFWQD